jgi:hypothetical protein
MIHIQIQNGKARRGGKGCDINEMDAGGQK